MLKRIIKTVSVAVTIVCLVVCIFPVQAFADPVSATIVANAFAQAIAAYGAANGVSMTFDVSNTSSIGESVHELWKDFRDGTQDADDYATLAAALFPDLYYKAATAVGTGSDIYTVGYNISAEYAEEFDNFYNWLLSGPAEMVQVDNQYYEFSSAQVGLDSVPVIVYSSGVMPSIPYIASGNSAVTYYENGYHAFSSRNYSYNVSKLTDSVPVYIFLSSAGDAMQVVAISTVAMTGFTVAYHNQYGTWSSGSVTGLAYGSIFYGTGTQDSATPFTTDIPVYPTILDGLVAFSDWLENPVGNSLGVKAYDNTGIADIPDTADPNYDALNRAREIPTDIPWDDSLYGDGTGTLTDAQTEAIASDVDLALVEDGVIELVDEAVEPAPSPNEVVIPFLPVGLPSFNFSFSGIWHYVREWVTSLGAWFATLFTIWSALPYAMVVPVYATAVVVIVLGVYKRFFM